MPMATRLETAGRYDELKDVYLKWSKIAFSMSLLAGLYFLIFGPAVMGWWIGPAFEKPAGEILQILMLANLIFLPARGVCLPVLMGMGNPAKATLAFLFSAVLNLVMTIVLVRPFGLAGVAWGTAIPSMVFGIAVWYLACRAVRVTIMEYLAYVVFRPLAGALPVVAIMLVYKANIHVQGLVGLGATGTAMAVMFAMIWIAFVYRNDPLVNIQGFMPAFVRKK
jgi:O-antigen/teichoic acid export membrane protein